MLNITLHPPADLTAADLARWEQFRGANPDTLGPFFHPTFLQTLANVRSGVEVAVVRRRGQAVAFFPFHRDARGAGSPAAGLLSDFEGVILAPEVDIDPQTLMRECGVSSWQFKHLLANQKVFTACHYTLHESPYISLEDGFSGYCRNRAAAGSSVVKRTYQKLRKLERRVGPLRFEFDAVDPGVLTELIYWKSQQYRAAGLVDLFEFKWVSALLHQLLQQRSEEFSGVLTALYAGDHLVAALAGMRTVTVLHPWFPSYSPAFANYSPGSVLLIELIRHAADHGVQRIDLGRGEERYKRRFKTGATLVAQGSVERSFVMHLVRKNCHLAYDWLRRSTLRAPLSIPGRMIKNATERAALK